MEFEHAAKTDGAPVLVDDSVVPEAFLITAALPDIVDVEGLPPTVTGDQVTQLRDDFRETNCVRCSTPYLAQNELIWTLFVETYQSLQVEDYISRCPRQCDSKTSEYLLAYKPSREAFLKLLIMPVKML
jgi:hypothetical protein